jgi:transposase
MSYPEAAWERAMKVQEVIMKALTGELHWYRAADILGFSPRTLRRWRERYESHGYDGLLDLRRRTPSPKRVPVTEVTRIVALYRDQYRGFKCAALSSDCAPRARRHVVVQLREAGTAARAAT